MILGNFLVPLVLDFLQGNVMIVGALKIVEYGREIAIHLGGMFL
jgi:hypothetical protein